MAKNPGTKEELLKELQALKHENESLKAAYTKDVSDRKIRKEENKILREQFARQQGILVEAATSPFVADGDVESISRLVTQLVSKYLEIERVSVWLFDETETNLQCLDLFELSLDKHSSGAILKEFEYKNEFDALKKSKYVDSDNPLTDPRTSGYIETYLKPLNITSLLDGVIRYSGRTLGVICLEYVNKPHNWTTEEITFVCQLADQIAITLSNRHSKRTEDLLQQTRNNYEAFFNTIDELLFVLDNQGNIIHTNSTVNNRLGYTEEELLGKSVLMVHPPERRDEAGRIVGEMLTGLAEFCPVPLITKSGSQIPVETRVTTGIWNGKPVIFGVTKDISQVKLSEEKFSKVFFLNPSACGLSDLVDGKYIEVNEAFCSLLGYDKSEVIGKTAMELGILAVDTRKTISQKAGADGRIFNAEAELKAKDGSIKHVLLSAENIYIQDKRLRYTVVNDITERKRTEEKLKESNHRWEAVIAASPDGIGLASLNGKIQFVSDKVADFFGYSVDEKDESLGKDISDFIHPSNHEILRANFLKLLAGEKDKNLAEYLAVRKDGSQFYLEINSAILLDYNGFPSNILFTERDITERKKAEEHLRQLSTRLELAVRAGGVGVWDRDIVNNILVWDDQMFRLYGLDKNNFSGTHEAWRKGLHPEDEIRGDAEIQLAILGRKEYDTEFRVIWEDGSVHDIRALAAVLRDKSGNPIRMIGTNWDITAQKKYHSVIQNQNEQLMELNNTKNKFFSIIAHDLKSPFNGFLGLTKILAQNANEISIGELTKISKSLYQSADNLSRLLLNLLEWAQIQKGSIPVEQKEILLTKILTENVTAIRNTTEQKGISININVADEIYVNADERMLNSILINLLSNAVKFSLPDGEIAISANVKDDKMIEISIKDLGIGIPENILVNLFILGEKTGRKGTDGELSTGLGLLLCKEFIEKNGGCIRVESEEGKGSTFYFTLKSAGSHFTIS